MVVAWAQTNADLDGVGVNRADGGAPDGAQSAPAMADNTAEFFAVAWVNGTGAAKSIRAKFYDSLGNPDPLLPGPIDLNDATGTIVSGPILAGWIEGYTAAWQEQAEPGGPVLYRARLVGPEAPVGQEFSLGVADPNGYAVLNQDKLSMAGWEQVLDPVAGTVAVGFNALWVSTVDTGGGALLDRIMLQRFEVPLDAPGNPQPAVAGGIDGRGGTGSDAAVVLGTGRAPQHGRAARRRAGHRLDRREQPCPGPLPEPGRDRRAGREPGELRHRRGRARGAWATSVKVVEFGAAKLATN